MRQNSLTTSLMIAGFVFAVGCSQQGQETSQQHPLEISAARPPVDVQKYKHEDKQQHFNISAGNPSTIVQTSPDSSPLAIEPERQVLEEVDRLLMTQGMTDSSVAGSRLKASKKEVRQKDQFPRSLPAIRLAAEPVDRERYAHFDDNPLKRVSESPVSTFSIDVDTGAYANLRRMLNSGRLPPADAVRAEELLNYFDYAYELPASTQTPFSVTREIAPTPWNEATHLLHIGIQGYELPEQQMPAANLVFLVDVSGSMNSNDKLGLLKTSLQMLSQRLDHNDRVSIVVYAGASGVVLQPTAGNQVAQIKAALQRLTAGGSTNGAAGIRLAYAMAEQAFIPDGINRVILATDGDFNVGTVNHEQLINLIEEKRKTGIALSTLGFGQGNYNDQLMEQLADAGNGNYAYIDTINEAQKVLVDEMTSTLLTIAKDVKIQIEFNPAVVEEYRLIGYENRQLRREDFNNDKVDAGEIGAGHSVTAVYEISLRGSQGQGIDALRYQAEKSLDRMADELAFLRIRYKQPEAQQSRLLEWPVLRSEIKTELASTSNAFRFSAAVAAFAQELRGGRQTGNFSYDAIRQLASQARGEDKFGYRGEFLRLVNLASSLSTRHVEPQPLVQRDDLRNIR